MYKMRSRNTKQIALFDSKSRIQAKTARKHKTEGGERSEKETKVLSHPSLKEMKSYTSLNLFNPLMPLNLIFYFFNRRIIHNELLYLPFFLSLTVTVIDFGFPVYSYVNISVNKLFIL